MSDILQRLTAILEDRRNADPSNSYVARLYSKGIDSILKKVGEEATEVVIAGKAGDKQQIVYEIADLWFHTCVLLHHHELTPGDVLSELERRFNTSGLVEKANREC